MEPQETYSVKQEGNIWYLVKTIPGGRQMTPFKSKAEVCKALEEIQNGPVCTYCGAFTAICMDQLDKEIMLEHTCCGNCAFYIMLANQKSKGMFADGCCVYTIGPEDRSNPFRGFGGRRAVVAYPDGRTISTTNLWSNGQASEKAAALFPQAKLTWR